MAPPSVRAGFCLLSGIAAGPIGSPAVPTDKRERQRAGREARREAARAAQRRAQRRRQIISVVALVAVIGAIGVVISFSGGGDDDSSTSASSSTTTTAKGDDAAAKDLGPTGSSQSCPATDGSAPTHRKFDGGPPIDCLTAGSRYSAEVETDVGSFTIALDQSKAPIAVNSVVFLGRYHAYDGVPFHRVIKDFVVQGGDVSLQDGMGDAGYKIAEEPPAAGAYEVGSVALAKASAPNSTGSQFFIITGPDGAALPPQYTLIGKVSEGLDVVKKIEADGDEPGSAGTPKVVHKIVKLTIDEKKG
jgi:cyclophilin family peptidyl-prolyl cis-trans isomerase